MYGEGRVFSFGSAADKEEKPASREEVWETRLC